MEQKSVSKEALMKIKLLHALAVTVKENNDKNIGKRADNLMVRIEQYASTVKVKPTIIDEEIIDLASVHLKACGLSPSTEVSGTLSDRARHKLKMTNRRIGAKWLRSQQKAGSEEIKSLEDLTQDEWDEVNEAYTDVCTSEGIEAINHMALIVYRLQKKGYDVMPKKDK